MSHIEFDGHTYPVDDENELVLDILLRHGLDIPYGCRAGACQACLLIADEGEIPANAQQGLSSAQQSLNYFLSCQCKAGGSNLALRKPDASSRIEAIVADKRWLNDSVMKLSLKTDLRYTPGQYVTLWKDKQTMRSYSLASHPRQDEYLELHIKKIADGAFSPWACETLSVGETIELQGPLGHCIYSGEVDQPLLLTAIGTGLSPILGILRDALFQQHEGRIELVFGANTASDFYCVNELKALAEDNSQLTVHFVAADQAHDETSDIYAYIKTHFPELSGWRIFTCGAESFVKKMRKQCFMAGAAMSAISADAFVSFSSDA